LGSPFVVSSTGKKTKACGKGFEAQQEPKSQFDSILLNDPRLGGRADPKRGRGFAPSGIKALNLGSVGRKVKDIV
jgi:hypothetical protein